jgi:hypothetical protein
MQVVFSKLKQAVLRILTNVTRIGMELHDPELPYEVLSTAAVLNPCQEASFEKHIAPTSGFFIAFVSLI